MDGDDFHTSLQQLRLQLDLMNKRNASVLNKSHQHSTKVIHDSSQVGQLRPVIMADYAQQIKHIGATVGALARQQEVRFQRLEHQLNLLSDKLDDLDLTDPQLTPPESSTSSLHEKAEPYFDLSFGKSSDIPRQTSGMPSATVADVGGYFYPNHIQYTHNNQQYISDALTFVGRVNRTLRTKSINNIEIFLRGSALRWFHIGLRIDGSHIFDHGSGEMNIAKFCQSLILLFGVPKSSRPEFDNEAARLEVSSMRSGILDDYAFPALENARQQGVDFDLDVVLNKAIKRYNKSSIPVSVDPNILKNKDLLEMLVCLRRSEFDQMLDKILPPQGHHVNEVTRAKVTSESIKGPGETSNEVKQDSISGTTNELFGDTPSLTITAASGDPSSSKSDRPEPRIKIITELPAARDCCGEQVLNSVEHKQKMRQGINFLADEGVEILSDFEEKLAALKNWLHKNHTHQDSDDEIKLLWHRVAYMIWIHEQRIQERAEQHFIRSQVSDSEFVYETEKPSRGHQRPFDSNSTTTGRTENPKNQIVRAQEKVCILDNRSKKAAVALNLETPKMLERFKPKVVESIEAADESYPPAPTAKSCPTTPIVPCQVAVNPLNSSELDHNIPVSPKIAKKFGLQPGRQPTQQQLLQMQQQMHMQRMAQQQKNTMEIEKTVQMDDYSQNIPHQQISVLKPQDRSGRSSVDIDRGCRTNVLSSTNINPTTLSSYEPLEQAPIGLSRTRPEQVFYQLPDHLKRDVLPFFAHSPERSVYLPHSASADMSKVTSISNYDTVENNKPPMNNCFLANSYRILPTAATEVPSIQESAELQAVLDGIPLIQAPEPPSSDEEGSVAREWYRRPYDEDPAPQAGTIDIPEGASNCLAGLTFVFTGQLTYLSREEGQNLVKRYGGKCMTAPSKNTSFVVLGAEAGPKKLRTIKQHKLRVIDEKGLFALISRLPARVCPVYERKKEAERIKNEIKNAAEEVLTTTTHGHQQDTSSIDLYSYVSGCTGAKEPLEEYLKHLELDSLDDQGWTHYAQMLKDHAAAVAEEDDHEIKIPHKPFWREREAMEAAGEIARSQKFRGW